MSNRSQSLDGGRIEFRPRSLLQQVEVDPICGAHMLRDDAATSVVHNGQTKYFCSSACRAQFLEDPDTYS